METAEIAGARRLAETDLAGGHPALDFVNTVGGLLGQEVRPEDELLHTYEDLLDYGVKTGTVPEAQARRLRRRVHQDPDTAAAALETAYETRRLVDAAFRPLAEGKRPKPAVLETLAEREAEAHARGRLVPHGDGFGWSWADADELEAPLWPVLSAAVDLLRDCPVDRLKGCGRCRWLFLDTTKNRSRRWCSMEECGTHTKIERYVERRRARRGAER